MNRLLSLFALSVVCMSVVATAQFYGGHYGGDLGGDFGGGYDGEEGHGQSQGQSHEEEYSHAPANYKYDYSVHDPHTHDVKSASESRHGDVVKGYYTLKEADGSTREVHYTADKKNGFNAIVTKDGHQVFPHIEAPHY